MVADTSTGATSTSPESESELVASTKKLTISTTSLNESARSTPSQNATSHPPRPTLQRVRSRSSVGPATAGMVRARTEAWMNNAQSSATSLQAKIQRPVPGNVFNTQYRSTTAETTKPTFTNSSHGTRNEPAVSAPLEPEPNRSQLHRHGRQRSNTVGEAVSFPAVKVDSLASPTSERASIPENHCHKCLERVTENGIRLQNGDRFHIGCFLCYGCHQIFTESEFHVVNGRPYHPGCVSLAPAVNITGIVTKCFHCHKIIGNKSIRLGVMNYHPECFTCTHCQKILHSTSRFFEVDGRVECEQCCEERDRDRLAPKIVPVARRKDNFAVPPPAVPVTVSNQGYGKVLEPSGPGMMASANGMVSPIPGQAKNIARSGSGYGSPNGYGHSNGSGQSSPQRSPASPGFAYSAQGGGGGENHSPKDLGLSADSPVIMMASPAAIRASPPVLTSLFSTRTRPLPKFGGVTICPRCQQAVGVMDQVPGPKNEKWHKKCLNCKGCKKVLDSSAMTRGEGEAYCRGCYFSPTDPSDVMAAVQATTQEAQSSTQAQTHINAQAQTVDTRPHSSSSSSSSSSPRNQEAIATHAASPVASSLDDQDKTPTKHVHPPRKAVETIATTMTTAKGATPNNENRHPPQDEDDPQNTHNEPNDPSESDPNDSSSTDTVNTDRDEEDPVNQEAISNDPESPKSRRESANRNKKTGIGGGVLMKIDVPSGQKVKKVLLNARSRHDTNHSIRKIVAERPETGQVFKATYSGVPVYEMICKGVAVMKRKSDSALNATQILKVADYDKPQRTRILEREVQIGLHEKVQGGYGKFQGTWVPYERGVVLCHEYNVETMLRPLLEYQPTEESPPLAPKHITATTFRSRKSKDLSMDPKAKTAVKKSDSSHPLPRSLEEHKGLGLPAHMFNHYDSDVSANELDQDQQKEDGDDKEDRDCKN
ncbi:hypothetical protein BG004_001939 [Podila humilis]|nr:hypothetical protein BG004_001939 [Podila humilis]